jgi:hypothetical protein
MGLLYDYHVMLALRFVKVTNCYVKYFVSIKALALPVLSSISCQTLLDAKIENNNIVITI